MKLNLAILALLPHALCTPQPMEAGELESALQAEHLDAWIESVAVKRQISKEAARSMVRAVTYEVGPESKEAGSAGGGGGGQGELERRGAPQQAYPEPYGHERLNDGMTRNRINDYHKRCSSSFDQPAKSPYTPTTGRSFWRAVSGDCHGKSVQIFCRLPDQFGPPGWNENAVGNVRQVSFMCADNQECTRFLAHNFPQALTVNFGGCVSLHEMNRKEYVGNVPINYGKYLCPMAPKTTRHWDIYAETVDGRPVIWKLFKGVDASNLIVSEAPDFMFGHMVEWRGTDLTLQPWLKFSRYDEKATIRLYTLVGW